MQGTGQDGILSEPWKWTINITGEKLFEILREVWANNMILAERTCGTIAPVYKTEDRDILKNYMRLNLVEM